MKAEPDISDNYHMSPPGWLYCILKLSCISPIPRFLGQKPNSSQLQEINIFNAVVSHIHAQIYSVSPLIINQPRISICL